MSIKKTLTISLYLVLRFLHLFVQFCITDYSCSIADLAARFV